MAYSANGGISIAEKSDVNKLRSDLSKVTNKLRSDLSKVTNASNVLHTDIAAIKSELDNLEKVAANKEFTILEIRQMWEN